MNIQSRVSKIARGWFGFDPQQGNHSQQYLWVDTKDEEKLCPPEVTKTIPWCHQTWLGSPCGKWRFTGGKNIRKWWIFQQAMFDYWMVNLSITGWKITDLMVHLPALAMFEMVKKPASEPDSPEIRPVYRPGGIDHQRSDHQIRGDSKPRSWGT